MCSQRSMRLASPPSWRSPPPLPEVHLPGCVGGRRAVGPACWGCYAVQARLAGGAAPSQLSGRAAEASAASAAPASSSKHTALPTHPRIPPPPHPHKPIDATTGVGPQIYTYVADRLLPLPPLLPSLLWPLPPLLLCFHCCRRCSPSFPQVQRHKVSTPVGGDSQRGVTHCSRLSSVIRRMHWGGGGVWGVCGCVGVWVVGVWVGWGWGGCVGGGWVCGVGGVGGGGGGARSALLRE